MALTSPASAFHAATLNALDPDTLDLQYPMSLGSFERYRDAQRVVDALADRGFPVENVAIVGTDLRSVERVTGRLTRARMAVASALSGFWMGLFVALVFAFFAHPTAALGLLITTPLLGAAFGLVWGQLGFNTLTRRGERDFASVSRLVATRYEVLVEHRFAAQAHQVLGTDRSDPLAAGL